jgi:surface protein
MEKNPYEKNKYVNKHQHLNIPQDEIERKWRLYEEEQEQMRILMGISAPGNSFTTPFISTWKTDNTSTGSSNSNQVRLPLMPNGAYNFLVNWGDGSINTIAAWDQPEATHTYAAVGTYTISITGYINGWSFAAISPATGATGDRLKLLTITQWGCLQFNSIITDSLINSGAFYNCTNLTLLTVSDTPNFKGSTSTFNFFRGCTALTLINNINKWDVSGITYFRSTFRECNNFNDNVGNWNTGNATNTSLMFYGSTGPTIAGKFTNGGSSSIGNWNTSNVTDMNSMFTYQPSFNQNIGAWDVSKVTNMTFMFYGCTVAPYGTFDNAGSNSIGSWNTGNVTNMAQVFQNQPAFNRNIGGWNTSKVTTMVGMFLMPATSVVGLGVFNNDGSSSINNWDTSNVTNMSSMFCGQQFFNQPIGNWNTVKVTNMSVMFYGSNVSGYPGLFNQDISNWNTSAVVAMNQMFYHQPNFNRNIGGWDVSKVTTFSSMFNTLATNGSFNNGGSSSINNWNTALVTNMNTMFRNQLGFNQLIENWNVSLVTDIANFMTNKTNLDYSTANYDALLIGWASRAVKPNLSINFGTIKYTAAASAARLILTSAPNNWTIVDGGI